MSIFSKKNHGVIDDERYENVYVIYDKVCKVVVSELVMTNTENFMYYGFKNFIDSIQKYPGFDSANYQLFFIGQFSRSTMQYRNCDRRLLCNGSQVDEIIDKLSMSEV